MRFILMALFTLTLTAKVLMCNADLAAKKGKALRPMHPADIRAGSLFMKEMQGDSLREARFLGLQSDSTFFWRFERGMPTIRVDRIDTYLLVKE